jgi:hypothetical protein
MVVADAERFIRQFPEFRMNPVAKTHRSLEYLENNEAFPGQYNRFVEELWSMEILYRLRRQNGHLSLLRKDCC